MNRRWGPSIGPDTTRFRLWAPDLDTLMLEIDGTGPRAMTATDEGWFEREARVRPGTRYRFRLPDGTVVPDPASRLQDGGPHGWSVLVDQGGYNWRAKDWCGRPWTQTVIQELHAGTLGGYDAIRERLDAIADLGVTAIELMPIGAFSGTKNWGYDGVLPYAPDESYGTPQQLKALIDAAHQRGLMMFLDVVYNHFGPDGNYLSSYARSFFDDAAQTPWGGAVAVDRPAVAAYFIENALMWLQDYRFDGLRFDAVHAIADNAFLDRMAVEIRSQLSPDRDVHLILENENNDAERLESTRYDAQWNDDFHNTMHVLLTGEIDAYYADFADDPTGRLARCLAEGFVYQGEPSRNHAGKRRGSPSAHLPPVRFVSFLQNHDQIGNRAFGERLITLAEEDRLKAATALLILCPHIPLIFMGDEVGAETPFLFFTDFAGELADAVRKGRRNEFAKFPAFSDPAQREQIPDPNAAESFRRSIPEPGQRGGEAWRDFYKLLLGVRHEHIIPRLTGAVSIGADVIGDKAVAARWRMGDQTELAIAINLGKSPVDFPDHPGDTIFSFGQPSLPPSILVNIH